MQKSPKNKKHKSEDLDDSRDYVKFGHIIFITFFWENITEGQIVYYYTKGYIFFDFHLKSRKES